MTLPIQSECNTTWSDSVSGNFVQPGQCRFTLRCIVTVYYDRFEYMPVCIRNEKNRLLRYLQCTKDAKQLPISFNSIHFRRLQDVLNFFLPIHIEGKQLTYTASDESWYLLICILRIIQTALVMTRYQTLCNKHSKLYNFYTS